jgi:fatty acid desaturase
VELADYQAHVKRFAHLKPHDGVAATWVLRVAALLALATWLSQAPVGPVWLLGQALMAVGMLQAFFVLHETGHRHYFRRGWANVVVGHLASVFALVPFTPWRTLHGEHHVWTGWRRHDPTLTGVRPGRLSAPFRFFVDACWACWIPIFTFSFGVLNFWNLPRLWRSHPGAADRARHAFSIAWLLGVYGLAGWLAGPWLLHTFALGTVGYFVLSDPLLLSQHAHMPIREPGDEAVQPNRLWEQDGVTRSIVFPRWFSRHVLLNFDAHILHHLFPHIPSYRMDPLFAEVRTVNTIDWWTWLKAAKRTPGHVLLFQSREETGHTW